MTIKILPYQDETVGKLASAELHFEDGPLAGLRLLGFEIWLRRDGSRSVTFPSYTEMENGRRYGVSLLRCTDTIDGQDRLHAQILDAYDAHMAQLKQRKG